MTVIAWLLDADPSIRWQVMRDLTREPPDVIAAERARVATEGWGARLLALQAAGRPVGRPAVVARLHRHVPRRSSSCAGWGSIPRASRRGARSASSASNHLAGPDFETPWADNPFFEGEVEPCINGNVVATGAYFGVDMTALVDRLLGEQLADGGWNCEVENGATVSSFGTTINVLEGLLEHERAIGGSARVGEARRRGEAYLLERRLFRRKSTGEVIDPDWLRVLVPAPGGTTTSCAGSTTCATPRSGPTSAWPRRSESSRTIAVPTAAGRSRTSTRARPTFEMEDGEGRPSRWNTLRALRVLDWFAA